MIQELLENIDKKIANCGYIDQRMINFLLGEEKQGPVVTAIVRGAEKYREELDRQKMELD